MSSKIVRLAALLVAFSLPPPAFANHEALARQHFERGKALARLGEHLSAIKEFELAYAEYPRPSILYNLAHEHEVLAEAGALDEMRRAVDFYQKYLDAQPKATDRSEVEATIINLKARIESAEAKARDVPVQTFPPAPTKLVSEDSPHAEPPPEAISSTEKPSAVPEATRSRRALWIGLGIAGGVVIGTAVGLGVGLSQASSPPATSLGNTGVMW